MIDREELARLSAQELLHYQELVRAYQALTALLAGDGPIPLDRLAEEQANAEEATAALRGLQPRLAPHRLLTDRVPEAIQAVWRTSATLATEAAAANAVLLTRADFRLTAALGRFGELQVGQRALSAYRGQRNGAGAVMADRQA